VAATINGYQSAVSIMFIGSTERRNVLSLLQEPCIVFCQETKQ